MFSKDRDLVSIVYFIEVSFLEEMYDSSVGT